MGNQQSIKRIFAITVGMTPQDVIDSKEATAQQKKMACVFDSDGNGEYSQREADVFNATTITDRGKNNISLWTRYKDGTKKETIIKENINTFKYSPNGDVKPYLAPSAEQIKNQNKQNFLKAFNIQEDKLVDKWPDLNIYATLDKTGVMMLYTSDKRFRNGIAADNTPNDRLKEFYGIDIDNSNKLDNFEILYHYMKQQNKNVSEEELLKNALDAYKYFCVKLMPFDNQNFVNENIQLIKKYESIICNSNKLKEFVKEKQTNCEARIKNISQAQAQSVGKKSEKDIQQQKLTNEQYTVHTQGHNARVVAIEKYPNGNMKRRIFKVIQANGCTPNKSRIYIENFDSRERLISEQKFESNNIELNMNIGTNNNKNNPRKLTNAQYTVSARTQGHDIRVVAIEKYPNGNMKRRIFKVIQANGCTPNKSRIHIENFDSRERLISEQKFESNNVELNMNY